MHWNSSGVLRHRKIIIFAMLRNTPWHTIGYDMATQIPARLPGIEPEQILAHPGVASAGPTRGYRRLTVAMAAGSPHIKNAVQTKACLVKINVGSTANIISWAWFHCISNALRLSW